MIRVPGYEVRELLDRGPRSTVYRAVREDGQTVILKHLTTPAPTTSDLGRYRYAFELTRDLELPGVCPSYELLEHDGRPLMVTEDIGGVSLRQLLGQRRLELVEVLRVAVEAAGSLSRLHQQRIVHRDINPSNLVVTRDMSRVQLIDFDLASRLLTTTTELVNPGSLEGTLAYISPEQTGRMNRAVDHRTDLYSLGVTLYEMLTGGLPFTKQDPMALVHAHMAVRPARPQGHPEPVIDIVMKLLEKNPEDRYQSASGLRTDLARCLAAAEAGREIEPFPLAERDVSPELRLSGHLYGREADVEALMEAFERAGSAVELVLVAGYSGVGKSSLVHEIHKPVTASRGRFASGKFDQLNRAPYTALIEVVQELTHDVLTRSSEDVKRVRSRVQQALGKDGGVITGIANELELLIGEQPAPEPLPPVEASARFQRIFQRFLHAFAAEDSPLVVFLDDLQWADASSLALIQQMVAAPLGGGLLLLGAYRDNEVDEAHALTRTVRELERVGAPVTTLTIKPLGRASVTRWLVDSFHSDPEPTGELARQIHAKTRGNPFFVERFVHALGDEGLLRFDEPSGAWAWDLAAVKALGITENVADLMAGRLARLPEDCQRALEVAACVGNRFQLGTLTHALDCGEPAEVAQALWPALGAGLLDPIGDGYRLVGLSDEDDEEVSYRFVHDRIQEAAYRSIPEAQRASTHLKIGRRLLVRGDHSGAGLFIVVDHLNAGRAGLDDPDERRRVAGLNLIAGRKAAASVAFEAARRYFGAGVALSGEAGWEDDYEATYELHRGLALASESCNDDEASIRTLHRALERARSVADKVNLLKIEAEQYGRTGAHGDCMTVGLRALALLGHPTPDPADAEAWAALGAEHAAGLEAALAGRQPIELLDLPEMSDEDARLVSEVLTVVSPVIWVNLYAIPVINPWLVRTFVENGHTDMSAMAYAAFAMQMSAFGQYQVADSWGQLATELADKRDERAAWPSVGFIYANWVAHWTHPLQEALSYGDRSIEAALDTGAGSMWAAWSTMVMPGLRLAGAGTLEQAIAQTRRNLRIAGDRFNVIDGVNIGKGALLPMYRLAGREEDLGAQLAAGDTEDAIHQRLLHYALIRGPLYAWRMIADYILGDYRSALAGYQQASDTIALGPGLITILQWRFFACLSMAALWHDGSDEEREAWGAFLEESAPVVESWAEMNPGVHKAKALLFAAERARIDGQSAAAATLYDRAIAAAEAGGPLPDLAIALERAGRFWRRLGKPRRSVGYLIDARLAYVRWGASGKVEALGREFPFLVPIAADADITRSRSSTRSRGHDALDTQTLLGATQAISTELVLEDLLDTLLEKVIENAGAQRVCLLLPSRSRGLEIRARASIQEVESDDVAWSLVRWVARSRARVVLGDAVGHERYGNDPHVLEAQPRSVLCQPILNHGALVGVLYLENNLAANAFTPERCQVLDVLASQAAISIQNARLFDEQTELNRSMARFLPSEFLGLLGRESVVDVALGEATEQEMTVLFSDIRGFTSRSEEMAPSEIFAFLNAYLQHAGPVIRRHGGFIDKYIGDEIMALFPSAEHAVRAGVDLMHALRVFNAELSADGAEPMQIGVGLHRGRLMLGTIGEPERMDGTVISDTVNVASRLQGLTKVMAAPVLVSAAALEGLSPTTYPRRFQGEVLLRGRQETLPLYEVFAAEDEQSRAHKLQTREDFEAGIRAMGDGDAAAAAAHFEAVLAVNPRDASARMHLLRAREA